MMTNCTACTKRPAVQFSGKDWLCAPCAQKRSATSALPYLGAALIAAGVCAIRARAEHRRSKI